MVRKINKKRTISLSSIPKWIKFTKTAADFAGPCTILLYQLPAGSILHGVKMKHSERFSTPGIFNIYLGMGSNPHGLGMLKANTPVSSVEFYAASVFEVAPHDASAAVTLTTWTFSEEKTPNSLKEGVVDIWLLVSRAR